MTSSEDHQNAIIEKASMIEMGDVGGYTSVNAPLRKEDLTTRQPTFPSEYGYREGNAAMIAITGFVIATTVSGLLDIFKPKASQNHIWIFLLGFGGVCQIFAGAKEFHHGNTLTSSIFMLFGFHWIGKGLLEGSLFFIHTTDPSPLDPAVLGCYYLVFTLYELMLTVLVYLSPNGSYLLFSILLCVQFKLILATVHCWVPDDGILRASGVFAVLCCLLAMYSFIAESLAEGGIIIPTGKFGGRVISRHEIHQELKKGSKYQ